MSCHDTAGTPGSGSVATLERTQRFALVGNPNAGKSTLFNALTGLRAKVANYPGVTVARYEGPATVGPNHGSHAETVTVEDLPGTYSLDPLSPDERIVVDALTDSTDSGNLTRPDALIAVLDATSLQRSLGLIAHLQRADLPLLVALTHSDELVRRGGAIDAAALSEAIGHPVVFTTAGDRRQLDHLRTLMADTDAWARPELPAPIDPMQAYTWTTSVLAAAGWKAPQADARTHRIDSILLHPLWGTLVFFATMLAFFQVIFTLAAPLQGWIEESCAWAAELARTHLPDGWIAGFVADGLIGGLGGVLVFVPQIALLFLMISLLESSGYMSRAAFLMDRVMSRAGLEGRAFVAMLSSLACAIPGIMATRSLPSAKDRLATMMAAPLMTCSARLPVYTMLISMMIPADARVGFLSMQGLAMFGMYLLGAVAAMTGAWAFGKVFGGSASALPLCMEMPSYQIPTLRQVAANTWIPVKGFLRKVGGIILVLTIVLWAFLNLPAASDEDMQAAGVDVSNSEEVATYQLEHSAGASVGRAVQPVFEPLGFDWRITVGVVASLGAREVFVSTLGQIASAEDPENPQDALATMEWGPGHHHGEALFTAPTIAALMIFFAFALQCTSTIAALKRESGAWKWPALAFVTFFTVAWIGAFAARLIVGAFV